MWLIESHITVCIIYKSLYYNTKVCTTVPIAIKHFIWGIVLFYYVLFHKIISYILWYLKYPKNKMNFALKFISVTLIAIDATGFTVTPVMTAIRNYREVWGFGHCILYIIISHSETSRKLEWKNMLSHIISKL